MKSAVGWIVALGGGYLVLRAMGINPLALLTPAPAPPPPTSPTTPTQTGTPSSAAASNTLAHLLTALSSANVDPNSFQTVDVWNYYYNQVRGIAGPAPEVLFVGVDRNKMYSLQEWWAAMTNAGFNGLGFIAHYVNPYMNPTRTYVGYSNRPYQANLGLRFMEKMPILIGQ